MKNPPIHQTFAEQLEFFRKKLNLPTEAWDDIERMAHDRAFIVAGAQGIAALSTEEETTSDELDTLAEDLAGDWERVTAPLVAPIKTLADEVNSFEEFEAMLPDLINKMDTDPLAEALAQGQFGARVWGNING